MPNLMYLVIAAVSGAAMALQGTLNSILGKVIGIWESTLIVHVIGTITVFIILLVIGTKVTSVTKLTEAPWYAYLGGFLNVLIIFTVVKTIPQIGVGNATTAIIVAQVSTAVLIDSLGLFGMKKYDFQYIDILGIALLAIGARILLLD
ncbi:MAG TPA: DMT family transporter [Syntrophomonadaceae bacterium]|nr:DMT family transporter [Syntrophomonadaceae bacterium]